MGRTFVRKQGGRQVAKVIDMQAWKKRKEEERIRGVFMRIIEGAEHDPFGTLETLQRCRGMITSPTALAWWDGLIEATRNIAKQRTMA